LKQIFLFAAGIALAHGAFAQELVTIQTRPGVTQSFFIANMGGRKPEAAALLLSGGGGNIRLRHEDGPIKFGERNFLPRSRRELIRNGVLPVILDNPSDQQAGDGMSDAFRESAEHAADLRAVLGEVKRRYPGLPLFLVGTSRSTLSVAHLARSLQGEVAGAVLSSSLFYTGGGTRARQVLAGFDWPAIKVPLLFVHHEDDGCGATPYREAARLGRQFPLITVRGGKPSESGPCDPLAPHGFFGREAETVDAIAGWMLGKPFVKEIQ
jgi:pimeloyl-ACP methyl ester carboxylesterase